MSTRLQRNCGSRLPGMSPRPKPAAPVPPFTWNANAGRYTDARGRFVATPTVRDAAQAVVAGSADRMAALSGRLAAGRISLAQWELGMAGEIKAIHLAQAAVAAGGWAQLTPADFGAVGAALRAQYRYLDGFARAIAAGTQALPGVAARARLYAAAARGTGQGIAGRAAGRAGKHMEANRLGMAEHCPGCVTETDRGWVPIGQLVPVGQRQCQVNCKCEVIYR